MAHTKDILSKKALAELKEIAGELDVEIEGLRKAEIIEAILDSQAAASDDDELDDDELDDEVDDLEEEDDELEELDDEEDDIDEAPKKKAPAKKPAAKKAAASDSDTLAAKQVATMLETDAKTLRQFLRSEASTFEAVGSGGRYEFTEGDVPKIKSEFEAWKTAKGTRGRGRPAGSGSKKKTENIEEIEEVDEIEELEEFDDEVDDEDLELDD